MFPNKEIVWKNTDFLFTLKSRKFWQGVPRGGQSELGPAPPTPPLPPTGHSLPSGTLHCLLAPCASEISVSARSRPVHALQPGPHLLQGRGGGTG